MAAVVRRVPAAGGRLIFVTASGVERGLVSARRTGGKVLDAAVDFLRRVEGATGALDTTEIERRESLMRVQFAKDSARWDRAMPADQALKLLTERIERDGGEVGRSG